MDKDQLWEAVLGELELTISKANFNTWFKNTFIYSWQENQVIIGTPNAFTLSWLEKKYHKEIIQALENITEHKIKKILYKIESKKEFALQKTISVPQVGEKSTTEISFNDQEQEELRIQKIQKQFNLNSKYSFKNIERAIFKKRG